MSGSKQVSKAVESLSAGFQATLIAGNIKAATQHKGTKSRDLWQAPIDDLHVMEGFNVRVKNAAYHEHIQNLAESMRNEGYYQSEPIAVYVARENGESIIYVTDGHCRLEAVKLANSQGAEIKEVPIVATAGGTNLEDLTVALIRSNSGKPLTSFEQAVVAKRLIKFGWTDKEVAKRMIVSTTTVKNYLSLMEAPAEVRVWVADGVLGMHKALETLRDMGAGAVEYLRQHLTAHAEKSEPRNAGGANPSTNDAGSNGSGSGRGERRNAVIPTFGSSVKKAAPRMFDVMSGIRTDKGYAGLSAETRGLIDNLVDELEKLRGASKDGEQAAGTDGKGDGAKAPEVAKQRELEEVA